MSETQNGETLEEAVERALAWMQRRHQMSKVDTTAATDDPKDRPAEEPEGDDEDVPEADAPKPVEEPKEPA